ncbi:MAG TPA: hypothetical protein VNT75_16870 [Symbiobacteriaceae bacterium]|nr:hypothetical protein [Symbiobacteriaceae bacterium]
MTEGLQATLVNGQVRIHLPFEVDPQRLSRQLLREGFPLAHQLETTDTQGWGQDFDPNGYYPYWIYPDPEHPGRSVFAFNPQPEDVVDSGGSDERVELGERSARVVRRWVPVLERLRRTEVQS